MVKKLLLRMAIITSLTFFVLSLPIIIYCLFPHPRPEVKVWQTEETFLMTPRNQNFDIAILGTSHAREFARYEGAWRKVQQILGTDRILMLARGGGGGIVHARFNLMYFYNEGNTVKELWYFFDPYILYTSYWNEYNPFRERVFDLKIFGELIKSGMEFNSVQAYYLTIFQNFNNYTVLERSYLAENAITAVDPHQIKLGLDNWYNDRDGLDQKNFKKYSRMLEQWIDMAQLHGSHVTFIIPPTLTEPQPGTKQVVELLGKLAKEKGIRYFDYSQSVPEPRYYQDHGHLNSAGVEFFTEKYLLPLYKSSKTVLQE